MGSVPTRCGPRTTVSRRMRHCPMPDPLRGEIWFTAFDPAPPAVGHEQAARRPALILSDDRYNVGPSGMVVVVPLTRRIRPVAMHVALTPPEGGLRMPSTILSDQVRALP